LALLDRLVEQHYGRVLHFLTRLTGSVSTAEDLTQSAFAGLVRSWKPLGNAEEDRAYVTQTAYNAWRRWRKRKARMPAGLELSDEIEAEDALPIEAACLEEEMASVRTCLDCLQPNHRAALVLIVLEGMPYDDVARLMGVPRDTVSKWRTRALTRMCEALKDREVYQGKAG